ncbi:MAG: PAS domain S-box protein, partial [Planctomycetales bacterium]|nr:PAS domain S-box protein [Planctomycetales bacterium]
MASIIKDQDHFQTLFEFAPDACYLNDLRGNFVDGNQAAERMIGYAREELVGRNMFSLQLLGARDLARATALLARNALGESTGPSEFVLHRKDGSRVSVEIRTRPVEVNGQRLVLGIARDIGARLAADEKLRASEHRFRELFDSTSEMIHCVLPDGTFAFVNRAWREALGYLEDDVTQLHIRDIVHPNSHEHCDDIFQTLRAGEAVEWIEVTLRTKSGESLLVEGRASCTFEDGEFAFTRGFFRDVTARKTAEAELSRLNEELEDRVKRRTEELSQANQRLAAEIREHREAQQRLSESEERFRAIFDSEPECVKLLDREGNLLDMNAAGLSLIEADSIGEVRGQCIYSIVAPEHREAFIAESEAVFEGRSGVLEFEIIGLKGSRRWMESHHVPLRDRAGAVTAVLAVTRDITERKRADEDLRRTASQLQAFFEVYPDLQFRVGADDTILDYHAGTANDLYVPPEHFLNRRVQEILPPDVFRKYATAMQEVRATGKMTSLEYQLPLPDGIATFEARLLPRESNEIVCLARNITDRKHAEQALRDSEEQSRTLLENHVDGVAVLVDFKIQYVNDPLCDLTGYSREELIGQSPLRLVAPNDQSRAAQRMQAWIRDEAVGALQATENEYEIVRKSGQKAPVEICSRSMRYQGRAAILSVLRDISRRKELEEESQRHRRLLAHANRVSTVGEMATGLAHELNQPLAAISMFADACIGTLKTDSNDVESVAAILQTLVEQARRAGSIVDRIRKFVGKEQFTQTPCYVQDLVNDVLSLLHLELSEQEVSVEVDIPEGLARVYVDRVQIEQVLVNLIHNSVDALSNCQSAPRNID